MKLIFENIRPDAESSFRIFSPKLHDFYFWHFHPEYEIVFIEAQSGIRHIGEHIGRFEGSDLILIGPNIPHLNFDYGIKTPYQKLVLQFREDFLENSFSHLPEMTPIKTLFDKAKHGIHFTATTKQLAGERLKKVQDLPKFEQLLEMLSIFQYLATSQEYALLSASPIQQHYNLKEQQRLKVVYRYVEEHYGNPIKVSDMANLTYLTKAAFCRYFKKMTLLTFTEFLNQYRINQAKKMLLLNTSISEVCFECGFESISYFNRIFKKTVGTAPLQFKKTHQ